MGNTPDRINYHGHVYVKTGVLSYIDRISRRDWFGPYRGDDKDKKREKSEQPKSPAPEKPEVKRTPQQEADEKWRKEHAAKHQQHEQKRESIKTKSQDPEAFFKEYGSCPKGMRRDKQANRCIPRQEWERKFGADKAK